VTLGLFAKHVIIRICDGDDAQPAFQAFLDDLHQQFEPSGFFEKWLVVQIAESMWPQFPKFRPGRAENAPTVSVPF
jgi:hypothetical protein